MLYAITGGTGFLGTNLVQLLLKNEHRVRVLARSVTPADVDDRVEIFKGSVADKQALEEAFEGADGVFHLAGIVEHSRRREEYVYEVNVCGTLNVLQAAKKSNIRRVVYASTSGTVAVSPNPSFVATDASPYAWETAAGWPYYKTKIIAEEEAIKYACGAGLDLICMRPTLLLGPGDRRLSSCRSIVDLLDQKIPFVPAGGLSFVDVRDAALAFLRAMEAGTPGSTYLLGHENMTLEEYFQQVERISGVEGPWLKIPNTAAWAMAASVNGLAGLFGRWDPSLDPVTVEMAQHFWYLDASKAREELDFVPRDGESTLRETIAWLQQHRSELQA